MFSKTSASPETAQEEGSLQAATTPAVSVTEQEAGEGLGQAVTKVNVTIST